MGTTITRRKAKTQVTRYWGGKHTGISYQLSQRQKPSTLNPFGRGHVNLSAREITALYKRVQKDKASRKRK